MSVIGKSPTSQKGKSFRNNAWWWRPLREYCEEIAPDLIPADHSGRFNDDWELDEEASRALADRLAQALASGETQAHAECLTAYFPTFCPFSVENVREFAAFLRDCGGFSIC
jgi:hypothetical protein